MQNRVLHEAVLRINCGMLDLEGLDRTLQNLHRRGTAGYYLRAFAECEGWRATPLGLAVVLGLEEACMTILSHSTGAADESAYRVYDDGPDSPHAILDAARESGFGATAIQALESSAAQARADRATLDALPTPHDLPAWEARVDAIVEAHRELAPSCDTSCPAEVESGVLLCSYDMVGPLLDSGRATAVVNCCPAMEDTSAGGHAYLAVECEDAPSYPIVQHFADVSRWVVTQLEGGGGGVGCPGGENPGVPPCVVVHCYGGINRSSAVCVAHLMLARGVCLTSALEAVLRVRPVALTNRAFRKQLIRFAAQEGLLR